MTNLFAAAHRCLALVDPAEKVAATHAAATAFAQGELPVSQAAPAPEPIVQPGRPPRPVLVLPKDLPQRGLGSVEGRVAFLHAIAHIEFNAINLAWDAVYRFRGMPDDFYADWVQVADDEARHFTLLSERLVELGAAYGDWPAHNGLWRMAERTADSDRERMALVPRVLEARGLDVTPGMIARLRETGDRISAEILELILREEVAHVAAGTRWFNWCCQRDGLAPGTEFARLVRQVARGSVRGPFNRVARMAAGFDAADMALLESL